MLPNFMCIGAQKSGTTTLAHILEAHPDVFMAKPRETRFFFDEHQYSEGLQKYELTYFSEWAGQQAVGEKCPEYLYMPAVAKRLAQAFGNKMKLIVSVRSPAQRAFSHYRHNLAMLRESRSFEAALASENAAQACQSVINPHYGYIARGCYAHQLKSYFHYFSPEQFLIVNFEQEVVRNQPKLSKRLFNFLEIDSMDLNVLPFKQGHPPLANLRVNLHLDDADTEKSFVEISRYRLGKRIVKPGLGWLRRKKHPHLNRYQTRVYNPSEVMIQFARNFKKNKPQENLLSPEQAVTINNRFFKEDIMALREMVPFAIDHWLTNSPIM